MGQQALSRLRFNADTASPTADLEGNADCGAAELEGVSMSEGSGDVKDNSDRRYAPAWCSSRLLRPVLCLFIGCGRPPEMTGRQWTVVSAVTAAGFFSHFDDDLLPLCLRQLQASLNIPEAQICLLISFIGMGRAGAAVTSVLADVIGRRHVFFASIIIFTICSIVSAFQQTILGFALLQFFARIFLAGKDSMANVYLVEETDPMTRGWVMGTYSSVAVCGGGFAVILFGAIGAFPDGWRYLYGLAAVQLAFLVPVWRRLPQEPAVAVHAKKRKHAVVDLPGASKGPGKDIFLSDRWMAAVRSGTRPLMLLVTAYPGRAAACLYVNFNNGFAIAPSAVLKIKHLQDTHGLPPRAVSMLAISSGLIALAIFPLLGRLSDSKGRRLLLTCAMTLCPLGVLAFYNAPGNTYLPFYVLQMMAGFALNVLSTTFFTETFPASHRCTAQGMMTLFSVLGGASGLACESLIYAQLGSHARSVSIIILPAFVSPIVVHCFLPETAGRDLNDIAPERGDSEDGDPAPDIVDDDDAKKLLQQSQKIDAS